MQYDYLIIGAGLTGAVFARELTDAGKRVMMVERDQVGGNCRTENHDGIEVHIHGPHIFHTSDEKVWKWVNRFTEFNGYVHRMKVCHDGQYYSFPVNLETMYQLRRCTTPDEMKKELPMRGEGDNFEQWCMSQFGYGIYSLFYKGYTEKQWGMKPDLISSSVAKRIPIRTTWNDLYFNDKHQGIPANGYMEMFNRILEGIEVLRADYMQEREYFNRQAKRIIYTGAIDEFYDYSLGELEYRSLRFEHERIEKEDYQGISIINYPSITVPYTRIVEHKHFNWVNKSHTFITKEYPLQWERGLTRYYPISTPRNKIIYKAYSDLPSGGVIFAGRLGEYKYINMDQAIADALNKVKLLLT